MTSSQRGAAPSDLQALFSLYSARRFGDMERHAQGLLQRYPDDGNVWKALSVAQQVQGADAVPALRKAIALLPRDAELPSNLGALLCDAGRFDEAIDSYRHALAIEPGFADAHANLGVALTRLGRFSDAAGALQRAVQLKPSSAQAHNNLAIALIGLQRPDEALAHYARAVALQPGFVAAHRGQGNALRELGRDADAIACYRRALALKEDDGQTHASLGAAEQQLGQIDAAERSYRRALALVPTSAAWHFDLGNVLAAAGRPDDAVAAFEKAITLQPAYLAALTNLGAALQQLGQSGQAVASLRQALALDPGAIAVLNNLGNALLADGQPEEALAQYRRAIVLVPSDPQARLNLARALRQLGRFDESLDHFRQVLAHDPDNFAVRSDTLFVQNYMDCRSGADLLADARAFGARAAASAHPYTAWPRDGRAVLRVGLVSGDLREHPVGYFAQDVLDSLAGQGAGEIELYVYANTRADDAVTRRIKACVHGWRTIEQLGDAEAAALIHADGIDILIDLAGHTAGNRLPLFAWRAAPVQLSWLGYCATTGMTEIDHVLTDPWIVPPGAEGQYGENVWRLPETFLCFTPPALDIEVAPLPALASAGRITFGCFNSLNKLNGSVIAIWSRILAALPASRLMLKAPQLAAASNRLALTAQFAAYGIAAERLELAGASPRADYLAAYNRVDMALDPFPYPGGTTSVEGLWMGVPVLTLAGKRALGRQGESILRNVGLDDWIARDADDYVERAVRLAGDTAALASLRAQLRGRLLMSPLCDAPRFAGHLMAALMQMRKNAGESA